jgi:glycosyltransferase involved in cell wall biosynthesis
VTAPNEIGPGADSTAWAAGRAATSRASDLDTNEPRASALKIAVVGINYAPEHAGIAPYTADAARHLASVGNDVLVMTGVPHYPSWRVPEQMRRRLRCDEHESGVHIRRLRHFVPRRQSAVRRGLYEATFGAHVAVQRLPWRPDVVLAVVPSLMGSVAAALLARRTGAALAVWVQDLMSTAATESGISGGRQARRLAAVAERYVFSAADSVGVISEGFRPHVVAGGATPAQVALVPNWSHVQLQSGDRAHRRDELAWSDGEVIALHSGNIGLKQGLENVVEAARLAADRSLPVRFVLLGDGNQRDRIEALGQGLPTLRLLQPVTDEYLVSTLAAADVLLVNERRGVRDMSLPSKLTSYFAAGRPVVAAVDPDGATAVEVMRSGGGCVVPSGDPRALLDAVIALAADPERARSIGERGRSYSVRNLSAQAAHARIETLILRAMKAQVCGRGL